MARVRIMLDTGVVHCCVCGKEKDLELPNPCPFCGVTFTEAEYRRGKSQGVTKFLVRERVRFRANLSDEKFLALEHAWHKDHLPTYEGYAEDFVNKRYQEFMEKGGVEFHEGSMTMNGEIVGRYEHDVPADSPERSQQ